MRVEKRLSFGFKGEWGKVYKLWTFDETPQNKTIKYQRSNYVDMGCDLQFKYVESGMDKSINVSQPISNLPTIAEYRTIKTTDAYFNDNTRNYECVVQVNDIIKAFGCYWLVDKIDEKSVFTPNKQTFYYLGIKRIFDEIIEE